MSVKVEASYPASATLSDSMGMNFQLVPISAELDEFDDGTCVATSDVASVDEHPVRAPMAITVASARPAPPSLERAF